MRVPIPLLAVIITFAVAGVGAFFGLAVTAYGAWRKVRHGRS